MNLPRALDNPSRYKNHNMKPCQFPGCDLYFEGRGYSKYCLEHRKKEYRKVIDKLNRKPVIRHNHNQNYCHDNVEVMDKHFKCALCGEDFQIKIYPNIFTYPKYCEEHRNEYKRLMWQNDHYKTPEPLVVEEKEEEEIPILPDIRETIIPSTEDVLGDYEDDTELSLFEEVVEPK